MTVQKLFLSIFILLMISVNLTSAQADLLTLRELADMNDFHIGAAVFTNHISNPTHREVFAREFNMLTPEHEAKMCEVQPTRERFVFTRFDSLLEFAEENDMTFRAHTLLWHECTPAWINNGDFTREEAIEILRNYIYTVVGRYKGRIPAWDVVNEAINNNTYRRTVWYDMIGEDYIELAFQFAHEADPDAKLFYNDFGGEGMNPKGNAIYEMVADLVERGVPIHGVGLQMHIELGATGTFQYVSPENLGQNIQRLGELGLEVHITELDVRYSGETTDEILERQAADYYRITQTCLESDYCTALVTWGVTDAYTWLRNASFVNNPTVQPLMFTDDYQPKPAYFAVYDALAVAAGVDSIYTDEERAELFDVELPETMTIEIPEPTMSDPNQLAPDSVAGVVYYAPVGIEITLDGDLSDWENIPTVTIVSMDNPDMSNETMTFASAADAEFLYFMADVTDRHITSGIYDPATEWYMEDSVEFYINATDDLFLSNYATGVAQIALLAANIGNDGDPLIGGGNVQDSDVSYIAVETADGYRIEASVPLVNDAWEISTDHNVMIGFQAHLNGSSSAEAGRTNKLIWSLADENDSSWQNPSVFGRLIFWNAGQQP